MELMGLTYKQMARLEELLIMANNEQVDYISRRVENRQLKTAIREVIDMNEKAL